ncbi:MAG: hypothetical protein ACYC27_05165 [Armatimonadota bacterium]
MLPSRHFDPLRPNRAFGIDDVYEFTHGVDSVCVYDIDTMDFVKEIPVGERPDCHSTSVDNRYLYMACAGGLYCIDQDSLEVVKHLDTGHVFGTNMMPDGDTMLLHDAYGGIQILKGIQDMDRIHIHKRLDVLRTNTNMETLGGKGHFIENGRFYLCNGWVSPAIYIIDLESDYSFDLFVEDSEGLHLPDDLVINHDKTKAYSACYHDQSYLAVIDIAGRQVIDKIKTGTGTCGLTMTNDERYVIASNDRDDSISVVDTETDKVIATPCARAGFEKLGITGYIQGISIGINDEVYVYGCSGNGALVKFRDITGDVKWAISYSGGKLSSDDM